MIEQRPDWCISRQRVWGVPIVAFECRDCGEHLLSAQAIQHVAQIFETEGADAWFVRPVEDLLPEGLSCSKCKGSRFEKGSDILDVWFDSGTSHAGVLENHPDLAWPADLYLEGSDQHRGWFHSSLLEAVATRGAAPFKSVITHGFVVDGEGRKMSKSLGNYVSAQDAVKDKGAEMMRLWVATEDYRNDVRMSKEIMDRIVETYRRIRNTARFGLGNLFDFSPDEHAVPVERLAREMDVWAMGRLSRLIERSRKAYEDYEFHIVISGINEFCVVELSSLYLDVAKDILYCDAATGASRRSVQTVLFEVVRGMAQLLAPILPFTAEEIWDHLPAFQGKSASVHLSDFSEPRVKPDEARDARWAKLLRVRTEVSKALEVLRKEKKIGQSLQAEVEVSAPEEFRDLLKDVEKDLPKLWIVSRARIVDSVSKHMQLFSSVELPGLEVGVVPVDGPRCERCWNYTADVGTVPSHLNLCGRCAQVVG